VRIFVGFQRGRTVGVICRGGVGSSSRRRKRRRGRRFASARSGASNVHRQHGSRRRGGCGGYAVPQDLEGFVSLSERAEHVAAVAGAEQYGDEEVWGRSDRGDVTEAVKCD
jgi:hypothetical protein